jgi:hypothetical protein
VVQLSDRPAEQRFIHTGVTWDNFKTIQQEFADSPDIRLFYYAGELEILSPSPEHEIVKGNIGYLIEDYLLGQGIDFVAPPPLEGEYEAFRIHLEANSLTVELKEHFTTEESARQVVEPFLTDGKLQSQWWKDVEELQGFQQHLSKLLTQISWVASNSFPQFKDLAT